MKKWFVLSLTFFSWASFANHSCTTKITTVDVQPNGNVAVSGDNLGVSNRVCSVTENYYSTTPEACKVLYSSLLTAFSAQKSVIFYFTNDAETSCNKGPWGSLAASGLYYVKVLK